MNLKILVSSPSLPSMITALKEKGIDEVLVYCVNGKSPLFTRRERYCIITLLT